MGLLSEGKPLRWDEAKKYAKFVQERGVSQFIHLYNISKDRADGPFKWGDEVEYILIKFDHEKKIARVSLKAERVFQKLAEKQKNEPKNSVWHPEFAAYMVEGTPKIPYGGNEQIIEGLCSMESNMKSRRQEVQQVLDTDETVMVLTNFPRLGCPNFTHPLFEPHPETSISGSCFFPDEAIYNGHPRFKTIASNVRARRKRKVIMNLPIYKDTNTPRPFKEEFTDREAKIAAKLDHVYLDAMGFGMGCCCLQVTLQATHLNESKVLYDHLGPICPITLALSAATPIFRGYLTEVDCRWQVIAGSVDDRTKEESGEISELKESEYKMPKSRYDTLSLYLTKQGQAYNDIVVPHNEKLFNKMLSNGVDREVARHVANLFVRDPVCLYKEKLEQTDKDTDHFENIQSSNWMNMRFKPPPGPSSCGWRVEYRPMEAQTTDFENAAYAAFVVLLSRCILTYKLNFLIPISMVDANMKESQKMDAVSSSKFWFRCNITPRSSCNKPLSNKLDNTSNANLCSKLDRNVSRSNYNTRSQLNSSVTTSMNSNNNNSISNNHNGSQANTGNEYNDDKTLSNCARLMSINEIMNGSDEFVGILPIVDHFIDSMNDGTNSENISLLKRYMKLLSDRASLRVVTTANWMRQRVLSHPAYKHDSVVSDEINYDLMIEMDKIGRDLMHPKELLGDILPQNQATSSQVDTVNFSSDLSSCCVARKSSQQRASKSPCLGTTASPSNSRRPLGSTRSAEERSTKCRPN